MTPWRLIRLSPALLSLALAALAPLALASLALAPLALVPSARAAEPALTPEQTDAVRNVVIEMLQQRPELVLEALRTLEARQQADQARAAVAAIAEKRPQLERRAGDPVLGNPDGDVTLVEFFDYRCPYCKQVDPILTEAMRRDGKLRVVLKDLPILGPDSAIAATAALAARAQGDAKYRALHHAMLTAKGSLDQPAVLQLARGAGLDADKLKADMNRPEITRQLQENLELARTLGIGGTPAFIIGDKLLPGAVDGEALSGAIQVARARAPLIRITPAGKPAG